MVRFATAACISLGLLTSIHAEITINQSTVNLNGALAQQLIGKLDSTLDQVFYGVASLAGPGIVNAAAFSSTIGIQRQSADLPKFQLEPSVGLILPGKNQGDERLSALPMYAVNLVGGYRFDEKTAIQARGFFLPETSITVKETTLTVQPYNFGLTLTRRVKAEGSEWYNPAIITPLDFGYMHGSLAANFKSSTKSFNFDPAGDGTKTASATMDFTDDFKLKWDVYTVTTGLILVKPFLYVFSLRAGLLSTLNMGTSSLTNTATGTMSVSASTGSGANEFKAGDTASIVVRNSANFKPLLVSNQITLGLGIALGAAALNFDLSQNLQMNATALIVHLGCWF
jgi:hypothetical protein